MQDRQTLRLTLAAAAMLLVPVPAGAAGKPRPATQPAAAASTKAAAAAQTRPVSSASGTTTAPAKPAAQSTTVIPRASRPVLSTVPTNAERSTKAARRVVHAVAAHAASAVSAEIVDFSFSPARLDIHVGDTVTWTNSGGQPHTATASGGGFDTGTLQHGQSASHTFTSAGSFTYYCRVHPFMHGTVVVSAASSGSSPGSGSSGATGTAAGSGATGSGAAGSPANATSNASGANAGASLPTTGLDLLATITIGLLLCSAGLVLRHRTPTGARPR